MFGSNSFLHSKSAIPEKFLVFFDKVLNCKGISLLELSLIKVYILSICFGGLLVQLLLKKQLFFFYIDLFYLSIH